MEVVVRETGGTCAALYLDTSRAIFELAARRPDHLLFNGATRTLTPPKDTQNEEETMVKYTFFRYSEEIKDSAARFNDQYGIAIVSYDNDTVPPLFGYTCRDKIVALAWGRTRGGERESEFHVAVDPNHQGQGLARRLGLRFVIENNPTTERYNFYTTEEGDHAFRTQLTDLGFRPSAGSGWEREQLSTEEMNALNSLAEDAQAIADSLTLNPRRNQRQ